MRRAGVFVDVEFHHLETTGMRCSELLEGRCDGLAGATPGRPRSNNTGPGAFSTSESNVASVV